MAASNAAMTAAVVVASSPLGRSSAKSSPRPTSARLRAPSCVSALPPSGAARFRALPPSPP
eukprot:3672686-Pleurochrysis_carterae.AAC.1